MIGRVFCPLANPGDYGLNVRRFDCRQLAVDALVNAHQIEPAAFDGFFRRKAPQNFQGHGPFLLRPVQAAQKIAGQAPEANIVRKAAHAIFRQRKPFLEIAHVAQCSGKGRDFGRAGQCAAAHVNGQGAGFFVFVKLPVNGEQPAGYLQIFRLANPRLFQQFRRFPQFAAQGQSRRVFVQPQDIVRVFSIHPARNFNGLVNLAALAQDCHKAQPVFGLRVKLCLFSGKSFRILVSFGQEQHIDFLPGERQICRLESQAIFNRLQRFRIQAKRMAGFGVKAVMEDVLLVPGQHFAGLFPRLFSFLPRLVKTDKRQAPGLPVNLFSLFAPFQGFLESAPAFVQARKHQRIFGLSGIAGCPCLEVAQRARLVAAPQPRLGQGLARLKRLSGLMRGLFQQPERALKVAAFACQPHKPEPGIDVAPVFFQRFFRFPQGVRLLAALRPYFCQKSQIRAIVRRVLAKDGAFRFRAHHVAAQKQGARQIVAGRVAHMGGHLHAQNLAPFGQRAFHIPAVQPAMAKIVQHARVIRNKLQPFLVGRNRFLRLVSGLQGRAAGKQHIRVIRPLPKIFSGGFRQVVLFGPLHAHKIQQRGRAVGCGMPGYYCLQPVQGLVRAPERDVDWQRAAQRLVGFRLHAGGFQAEVQGLAQLAAGGKLAGLLQVLGGGLIHGCVVC